jgi:hypothetical protein
MYSETITIGPVIPTTTIAVTRINIRTLDTTDVLLNLFTADTSLRNDPVCYPEQVGTDLQTGGVGAHQIDFKDDTPLLHHQADDPSLLDER